MFVFLQPLSSESSLKNYEGKEKNMLNIFVN
jgi:hypothetical protein